MADSREVQWVVGEGESYGLVFSFRAMQALKDRWGLKSENEVGLEIAKLQTDGFDVSRLCDIFWAATRTNHRDLTPDDILDKLDRLGFHALEEINETLAKLIRASMPQADGPGGGNPPTLASANASGQ